ncbi:MAG: T9SS type A sorting domain-containing protein [Flavobacteriales bacterium]|nr:T9SS type A sorting domain-containing protein [Flavobacteriales bacterium]
MNTNHTLRFLVPLRGSFVIALVGLVATCFSQGTVDPDFNVGTGASNRVTCAALQLNGKVIIGGAFITYNGTTANHVARLNLDGSLDGTFAPISGADQQLNSVALTSTGQAVIGGTFITYDGTSRKRIARLNADGTLDTGFDPGTGFNGMVTNVAVQSDDKVIAVGDFTSFNGTGRVRIARLNTDGTLDTSFDPGTGANFLVATVAIQSDGKVLIGGYFNDINGTTAVALARLNSDGSLDTGYNSGGSGLNNSVNVISLQPDGKALVGGLFSTYNGTGRNRVLRTNTDGSLDTGFDPGTGFNGQVLAFAQQSDGAIIIGGDFTTLNGNTHNRHCRVTSTGATDATWTTGANQAINCLLWMPEGRVVVGGIFTTIAGNSRNRISRFKALCTDDVDLVITTDGAGSETGWELIPDGYQYAAYSGSGLPDNAVVPVGGCLALGCYELRVTDSGTNGITDGGYVLKSQNGERIIDDSLNFDSGGASQISGGQGGPVKFCVPIGTHKPIFTSRDKIDWVDNEYFVSSEKAAVSQVWTDYGPGSAERANTGYDFWFFDPNGGYSFVRQRRHSSSDGFGPASPTRACHMKINNWAVANHIPANTLMNVRIRPVILGVAGAWGPAHRFKIDALRAQCPLTKLMDIPNNQFFSCGQTRAWGPGNYVHARPVNGANKYQFRFRIPAEAFSVTRNSNNYFLLLNWVVNPLECSKTYQVDVRASFDGGATWCSDFIPPALDPWGDVCLLTIANCVQGNDPRMAMEDEEPAEGSGIAIWPNPNDGEVLNLRIVGLDPIPQQLNITVLDATGRVAHQEAHAINDIGWSGAVGIAQQFPAGVYMVQVTAGEQRWMERFVVQ